MVSPCFIFPIGPVMFSVQFCRMEGFPIAQTLALKQKHPYLFFMLLSLAKKELIFSLATDYAGKIRKQGKYVLFQCLN